MDRRRFAPSPDGLEGRMLLSTARPSSATVTAQAPVANLSSTLREKELRIERLPYFLQTLQPGRVLPEATITRLQADLNTIVARLQPPPSEVLDAFNLGLRDVLPNASLSAEDARTLNRLVRERPGRRGGHSPVRRESPERHERADPGRHERPQSGDAGHQRLRARAPDGARGRPTDPGAGPSETLRGRPRPGPGGERHRQSSADPDGKLCLGPHHRNPRRRHRPGPRDGPGRERWHDTR